MSLSFDTGVTGILGPNGAGKTTLLSVLATALHVAPNHAWVGGHDVGTGTGRRAARNLIGWLPQRFDLASGMKVGEVVAYAAWANGVSAAASGQSASAALKVVDLADRADERVRQLSGGQRQRLGLAAALAHSPAIVLLDEPSVGLDPQQRVRFRSSVRIAAQQRTVLLSTHLLEDVSALCDQVVVMNEGKVLYCGSLAGLIERGDEAALRSLERVPVGQSALETGYLSLLSCADIPDNL